MADAGPFWQLLGTGLGLGLAWTSLHCAGMCGPLVAGFRLGAHPESRRPTLRAAAGLACYQLGRMGLYAVAGALVGALGETLGSRLRDWDLVLGGLLAAGFFLAALRQLGWLRWRRPAAATDHAGERPPFAGRVAARILGTPGTPGTFGDRPLLRAGALGMAMAFLPCGIVFWALGLAAATASPLYGALTMAALVVLTTPALLTVALGAHLALGGWREALRRRAGRWLGPASLAFSGTWILVVFVARHCAGGSCCP
jgi:sulfite exporter TauE/SafE